ncbi:MAG: transcriptional activator NhaR [Rhodocyclaceae bacterium]
MNYKHLHYFWSVARSGSIQKASEQLHITPQTLSGQIKLLEERLGSPLFRKVGRRLQLTETGRLVSGYADEIFTLGEELESSLRSGARRDRPLEFKVGVADSVPKTVACRLLEPAMQMPDPVRLICREWKLERLMSELALHHLDLVIADRPLPAGSGVRAYSHELGRSGVSFFAAPSLARRCKQPFPQCLNDMPMLSMGDDAALRGRLQRWLTEQRLHPRIVAEFDDGALMKAFGREAKGIFMGTTALEDEICQQYGVKVLGRSDAVQETFYAISVERRISHPCVVAITTAARTRLFAQKGLAPDVPDKAVKPRTSRRAAR